MFPAAELIRRQDKDCLYGSDIHSLRQNENQENCREWCSGNCNCGGFTVYHNICFFKNKNCKDHTTEKRGRSLFMKHGKGKYFSVKYFEFAIL